LVFSVIMPFEKIEKISDYSAWALWKITESEEELMRMIELDQQSENEISNIKFQPRRLEGITSRLTLKKLVEIMGVEYRGIWKDDHGKPFLNKSSYHVSITHSFPYVGVN